MRKKLAVEDRALPLELVDHQRAKPAATTWKPSESCRESKEDNQTTRLQVLHVKHGTTNDSCTQQGHHSGDINANCTLLGIGAATTRNKPGCGVRESDLPITDKVKI